MLLSLLFGIAISPFMQRPNELSFDEAISLVPALDLCNYTKNLAVLPTASCPAT
jgi:hypothetical protein